MVSGAVNMQAITGIVVGEGKDVTQDECEESADQQPSTLRIRPVGHHRQEEENLVRRGKDPEETRGRRCGHEQPPVLQPFRSTAQIRSKDDSIIERGAE